MITLFGYPFDQQGLLLFGLVGMLIGMAKVGVNNAGMIAVPILAILFGGKNSSGIMLPILIMADLFGVSYYHRHADWSHLKKLLPFAVVGVVIGTLVGENINDQLFRLIMGIIVFLSLGIMIWQEKKGSEDVPQNQWFAGSIGVLGGITTMIGNLAGSVMSLYLLAMRMPKNQFIGTAAWFFLVINLIKVPFHVFVWDTISVDTFLLDLTLLPVIGLGAFLGLQIVKRIREKAYRYFIIIMTGVAAIAMIV